MAPDFLTWGLFFAVFVVRGLLPFLVVWITVPEISFTQAFWAMFSSSPDIAHAIEEGQAFNFNGCRCVFIFAFICIGFF